jgi:hypothetical protein
MIKTSHVSGLKLKFYVFLHGTFNVENELSCEGKVIHYISDQILRGIIKIFGRIVFSLKIFS